MSFARLWRLLFTPVDIASLAVFRIGFGLLMARELYVYLEQGKVEASWVRPAFHFTWLLFDWVKPWPGIGMFLHFYALLALALFVAAGLFYRVSISLFCVGFTYLFLIDQAKYQNHWYLICLLAAAMAVIPAHRALSLDAKLEPGLGSEQAPAWALWLLRGQIGLVYLFGGIAKLNPDWLHGQPMKLWLPGSIGLPLLEPVLEHPAAALLASWSGLLIDLFMFPGLIFRRTRPYAFAVATVFHLLNSQMFQIGVFPWLAIWCTMLFFDPDWPRRVFAWPRREPLAPAGPPRWEVRARATAGLLAAYFAVQILVPLRHFVYPGNVSWTGEGHRFAWHMRLASKTGLTRFRLTDPETGRSWDVDPRDELSEEQAQRMAGDPAMILQYAHHLAGLASRDDGPRVEVRAIAVATLNGHPAEPLIDPETDLAAVPRELFGATPWILPQNNELGRRVRETMTWTGGGVSSRLDPSVD
jgi:hypothetical protein